MTVPPRRVLYVFANAHLGGAENITLLMLRSHSPTRYLAQALFLQQGPLVSEATRLGFTAHCLPGLLRLRHPRAVAQAISAVTQVIDGERIELVHSCMPYAHIIAAAAAWRRKIPVVMFQHGPVGGSLNLIASLLPTRLVLTNSAYTLGKQAKTQVRPWPIRVIPLATELTQIPPQADQVHKDHVVVTMLSRLAPGKGLDFAIEALAPLMQRDQRLRLVIVGGPFRQFFPRYQEQLQLLANAHKVGDQVQFTGFQRDIRPYLARSHILLSASFEEAFGLTLIEGLAAGVAVISSRVGGAAEVLQDGVDGLYFTAGDGADLRRQVERLQHDPDLRGQLIRAGLRTVAARYRPGVMMEHLERCYDEALSRQAPEVPVRTAL